MKSLGVPKLYIRFFDVDWDQGKNVPAPVAPLRFADTPGVSVVPVVYLTNRTFLNIAGNAIPELASNTSSLLKSAILASGIQTPAELQFDCDWTDRTRAGYFSFLAAIRQMWPGVKLSATIRLHQVKYFTRTGVPPVDKGMLMFYNMGSLKDTTVNSIYDEATARKYLYNFDQYPLALDVALPLFQWLVVERRGKVVHLLHDADREVLETNNKIIRTDTQKYEVQENTFFMGMYLYRGDKLRMEEIGPETALHAARLISPYLSSDTLTVSLYHWNAAQILSYPSSQIEAVYEAFR